MTLKEWMRRNKVTNPALADQLGLSADSARFTIGHYRNGTRLPTLKRAWQIFKATEGKVGLEDWFRRKR